MSISEKMKLNEVADQCEEGRIDVGDIGFLIFANEDRNLKRILLSKLKKIDPEDPRKSSEQGSVDFTHLSEYSAEEDNSKDYPEFASQSSFPLNATGPQFVKTTVMLHKSLEGLGYEETPAFRAFIKGFYTR